MSDRLDVIVIGAGQAGLAMGYYLAQQGRSFLLLDGAPAIGHSWRTRYDSLVLFTPAQYNNLPGLPFPAPPDHYPTKDEVADYLTEYARTFDLPVRLNTRITSLVADEGGYRVTGQDETFTARQVVVATGPFQRPYTPPFARDLSPGVCQLHSTAYRNPAQLPPGAALVVGAGNSGAQLAAELAESRKVYLAAPRTPFYLPQRFLSRDTFWWLHRLHLMSVTIDSPLGQRMSRLEPIFGTDLARLARERGLERRGRVSSVRGNRLLFQDGRSLTVPTVLWATGFRPDFSWLQVPVLDARGHPIHRRGVTAAPGLYFLGLPWQHTRGSALLGGVGRDADWLASQMTLALPSDAPAASVQALPGRSRNTQSETAP